MVLFPSIGTKNPQSITGLVQFNLSPKCLVHEDGIEKHQRCTYSHDDHHDLQGFGGRRGIIDIYIVDRVYRGTQQYRIQFNRYQDQ